MSDNSDENDEIKNILFFTGDFMTKQINTINPESNSSLKTTDYHSDRFTEKVMRYNAIACSPLRGDKFNRQEAIAESQDNMKALKAQNSIQEMLVAQMTSIHVLQQTTIALANTTGFTDSKQYYTNSAVKLANCFTQQAALLAKLQGLGGQKIVVEHVEVHHGGQAVVGNINGVTPTKKDKK